MERHVYAIALGSNRPLSRTLKPDAILRLVATLLATPPFTLLAFAPIVTSRPVGPSRRSYANSAAVVETSLAPLAMLDALQHIEREHGRKRARRWGERTLDLDIIFWSGGTFRSRRRLLIPHERWATREFVMGPLARIAPYWRIPGEGGHISARHARFNRPRPVDRLRVVKNPRAI